MGSFNHFSIQWVLTPPPPPDMKIAFKMDSMPLTMLGLNMIVEIFTASVLRKQPNPIPLSTITVMAHFDTGASITSIDINLAKHLNLTPIGESTSNTAKGPQKTPNFCIDLNFSGTTLQPFHNLKVGSCTLPFNIEKEISPRNFGILIGRDVMSRWNIIWNGPSSTVFISD